MQGNQMGFYSKVNRRTLLRLGSQPRVGYPPIFWMLKVIVLPSVRPPRPWATGTGVGGFKTVSALIQVPSDLRVVRTHRTGKGKPEKTLQTSIARKCPAGRPVCPWSPWTGL